MQAHPTVHPSADVLKAFGLGKLDDTSAGVLIDHLDQCEDCRKAVASQSGDDFLKRFRQTHVPNSTPAPAKSLAGIPPDAKLPGRPTALHNLPPELAAHPQYEILRELGQGGMGVVYLAKNKLMDRLEVLKVINKALLDRPGTVERFLREIRSAAKLSHANVVGAYSALQLGDVLAFAMEYVEGEDLAVLVKSNGPLPVANACYYIQQAALGLQHAFEKNMVHRDIKPQNLILAREGKKHVVKILDFGLAKVTREKVEDTGLTGEGKMLGTPDYIAPEQTLDAASADIRADIYSLGCTLYYLLSGRPPFSAASLGAILLAHQMQEAPLLNLARPEVPEELAAVVRKMMAKQPARRYQTPAEVARALAAFIKPGAKGGTTPKSSPDLSVGEPEAKRSVAPTTENVRRAAATTQLPPASGLETLSGDSSSSAESRKSATTRKRRRPVVPSTVRKQWLIGGGVGVGVLVLALLGMWAGGVFKVKTKDGTIVLENLPADAEVSVDGETVTIKPSDGNGFAIRVAAGKKHQLQVKKEGFKVFGEEVEIDAGDRRPILVRLEAQPVADKPAVASRPVADNPVVAAQPAPDKPVPVVEDVAQDNGFVPLFNGKDLTGWSVDGGPPGQWSVEGNTVVGQSKHFSTRNYLLTDKDYADFVFRFDFKVEDGSHGGVGIRAIEGEKMPLNNGLLFDHPLIKLTDPPRGEKEPTGTTHWLKSAAAYVRPLEVLPLPTGTWHSMEVVVRGDNCTATIGGKKLVNVTLDPDTRNSGTFTPGLGRRKGKVGFQINTGIVRYRKIEIKELPPTKAEAPLAADPPGAADGFVSLFNGKDLTGWIESNGNPAAWRVFDGVLEVVPGKGNLMTTENFGPDFQLHAEFNIPLYADRKGQGRGNSGIFLLGGYEIQILDSYNNPQPPERACAALYGIIGPSRNVCKPPNEWQTYDITFRSPRLDDHKKVVQPGELTVVHNGVVVIDKGKFDSFTPGGSAQGVVTRGPILLQNHNNVVRFRKLQIKPLDVAPISKPKEKAGFVPLFNGKDLTGWKTHPTQPGGWTVEDGFLVGRSATHNHLFSTRGDYADFHLKAEARINKFGNSGICFRSDFGLNRGEVFPDAYEAQILHSYPKPGVQLTGSLCRFNPVQRALVKSDEWFTLEILARGNRIVIKVNGEVTVDFVDKDNTYRKGHLVLQAMSDKVVADTTVVRFRKIEIEELPTANVAAKAPPRPGASDLPPEATAAAKAFEKSATDARAKLLADFDTALDRLAKSKGSIEQRLKLIEAVKEEKTRFESAGSIPWSEPMRPFVAKYFASARSAESKVRLAYNAVIDAQLRAKNENVIADLRADLENLLAARVVARWKEFRDGKLEYLIPLYSNGRIGRIDGLNTWFYAKGVLILRYPNAKAPGGAWIATLKVSADGMTFAGTNNDPRRPLFTGVYVKGD